MRKHERILMVLTLIAMVLGAVASTMYYTRIDLTSSRAFTLSKAARGLHAEIPEQIRITYYISKSLADRHPGPAAIEDFLSELEAVSRGKIQVRVVDPTKNPAEAESFGLVAQQMQVVEQSEQRLALVYTGIVIEYLDRHQTIPAILSTDTLEYEIVKAIRAAISDRKPVAGLLVGDADKSLANDYQSLANGLAQAGYEPREVRPGTAIDDDVDLLYVLGNSSIDRYDAAFMDSFLMRGGKAFFAVKGVNVDPNNGLIAKALPDGGLLPVLASYGFDIARQLVLDQSNLTVPFQSQAPNGGYQIQYVRYPHWVAIDARFTSAGNPITAHFAGLDLYWPSPMTLRPIGTVQYEELAKTTTKAWLQTKNFAAGPQDQPLYALERDATTGQYLVAAAAKGSFPSAFAAGPAPTRAGSLPPPAPVATSSPETRIVVVSSADFLTDMMRMSDSSFNASFALAAADWLVSADDLIAIRARAVIDTRLNRIKDADLKAFMVALTYIVTLGLVPLAVIGYGLARAGRRARKEKESRTMRGGEA
jgi:ABC-type uncharacterized transport system involved in gliding motility auxiliary subunit